MKKTTQLLKTTGLRRTTAREAILQMLASAGRPLSHQDILKRRKGTVSLDRVTVYRTLETLQEAGLLHRIQGMDGSWRFCRHKSESPDKCAGNHIHFLCSRCDQMSCLPEQPLPWVAAPVGATIHSKQLVVYGHCAACVAKVKAVGKNR
ncbi:MAG: transcriptional repressor [Acidobacteriia bacterium]|nr:transcriptional repressor [Terriglobia bacterium]